MEGGARAAAAAQGLRGLLRRVLPRARAVRVTAVCVLLLLAPALWIARTERHSLWHPHPSRLLVDRHGLPLAELPGENEALGYWELPAQLPPKLVAATLQAEDRRYFSHGGVEVRSVLRALLQDLRLRRVVSGASTIAMQVARLQHKERRTPLHKLREMTEAILLLRENGHEAVLRHYLDLAPYGHRARGAARAARLYFDRPAEDLSWAQAAFLAALPQRPGRMDPFDAEGKQRALLRMRRILRGLREAGTLTEADYQQALHGELSLSKAPRRQPEALHAVLAAAQELDRPAASPPSGNTLSHLLETSLDLELQAEAALALSEGVAAVQGRGAGNGALLAIDPRTGEVLAHAGSASWFSAEERGAIDYARARRSPGSALKPFLYALAFAQGRATAATELPDLPLDLPGEGGRAENVDRLFFGPVLAREALGNSRNLPAMRLLESVGVEGALRLFEGGGVRALSWEPGRYGLGLALGNLHVTLEELASLYAVLARGGTRVALTRRLQPPPELGAAQTQRLLPEDAALLTTHILADALARRPTFPAGGPLDFDGAVAVKTGTSQGHRDAWAVAYDEKLVVAVWIGNHDWRRTDGLTGASAAAPIAHRVFEKAQELRAALRPAAERSAFALPGFSRRTICSLSGRLASAGCPHTKEERFAPGTEPQEECAWHQPVRIDVRSGLLAGASCPARFVARRLLPALPDRYRDWARAMRLEVAPQVQSRLCPQSGPQPLARRLVITSPRVRGRILRDPETPAELSTLQLAARVDPPGAGEEVVWLVDGEPVARVEAPFEARWRLRSGTHVIRAVGVRGGESAKVTVVVE
jgi:penicillin-binding protein 1C